MKILFYNLGYARGFDGSPSTYRRFGGRLINQSIGGQKAVLDGVAKLVRHERPALFAYCELAEGRWRNRRFDQANYLESHFSDRGGRGERAVKYHSPVLTRLPYHSGNVNGYIAFLPPDVARTHTLSVGSKRLVFEIRFGELSVFILHLSLRRKKRAVQLRELAGLIEACAGDVVVCGDLNLFHGLGELDELVSRTKLRPAGANEPTFPAFAPKLQLDLFLYRFRDPAVAPELQVLPAEHSDHLPITLEWDSSQA